MSVKRLRDIGERARQGRELERLAFVVECMGMLCFALGVALGIPLLVWGMLTVTLLSVTLYVWGVKVSQSARERLDKLVRDLKS